MIHLYAKASTFNLRCLTGRSVQHHASSGHAPRQSDRRPRRLHWCYRSLPASDKHHKSSLATSGCSSVLLDEADNQSGRHVSHGIQLASQVACRSLKAGRTAPGDGNGRRRGPWPGCRRARVPEPWTGDGACLPTSLDGFVRTALRTARALLSVVTRRGRLPPPPPPPACAYRPRLLLAIHALRQSAALS